MTRMIAHRRNTIQLLKETPHGYGVEVDIRSYMNKLIIHHEPFVNGELFEDWLIEYNHNTLILNVKEEGLEERLIALMHKSNITNFFFLDQSFPFLIKYSNLGERRCAVRISEFESIDTAMTLKGKIEWAWIDCFTHFPLTSEQATLLQKSGFKLCIVSPELQGRSAESEIPTLCNFLNENKIIADAICTKQPSIWEACSKHE